MKMSIKIFAYAATASMLLLACDKIGINSTVENSPDDRIPAMASSVVSYQRVRVSDYIVQLLGDQRYKNGFITDEEILKLWFPHIFNEGQAKSECNYFALHFINSSSGLMNSYEVLSEDMALYMVGCTWKGLGVSTTDFAHRAMLICDDKDWKLKESINLDSIQFFRDPNWECESGEGGPNWKEIYNCKQSVYQSCQGEGKKRVRIYDMQEVEKSENARNLDIPCSIKLGLQTWSALLTEDEIEALNAKYDDIFVSGELDIASNGGCL